MNIVLNDNTTFEVNEAREFVQYEDGLLGKDLIYTLVFNIVDNTLSLDEIAPKFSDENLASFVLNTDTMAKNFAGYSLRNSEVNLDSSASTVKVVLAKK